MKPLEIVKTTVKIGLKKPTRILHITDSHISLADENDPPEIQRLADERRRCFESTDGDTERLCLEALDYARKEKLLVVCTGDLIDFRSHANFAFLDKALADVDYIYALGNHDVCRVPGGDVEDAAFKRKSLKVTAPHLKSNQYIDSRIYGGVNFVTADNSYYLMDDGQISYLRAEAAKGYPIVLCVHTPLYTPRFAAESMAEHKVCSYLMAPPEELLEKYSPDRRAQQTPDEATRRAFAYISGEPMLCAVLAGHEHRSFEEPLTSGVMQYTTDGSFHGVVREVEFI